MNKLRKILLRKRIVYILYNIIMLIIAFILNKFFQMLVFILFFNTIQGCFHYRFHADTIYPDDPIKAGRYCKIITFVVEITFMLFCKDLNVSVYSNLLVIFFIALCNSLLQFYLEKVIINSSILFNKDKLLQRCKEVKLSQIATERLLQHYIKKISIQEIAIQECVEPLTIKQSIRRSKRKLGL